MHKRWTFAWKTTVLALATVAFIPVLLYESVLGTKFYIWGLIVIHVVAIAAFMVGVKREDIAPTRSGLWIRVLGLAFAFGLLWLAEKGMRSPFGEALFWWSLFGVWAIHTGGLALLHLRGDAEHACIFAAEPRSTS